MRILAIRGQNLASLAGEFQVDFQAEPLASAGVFAISGPTGAGKSTVLDALCLALYHDTPRLLVAKEQGVTVPDAGEHTISPQDPRNLLRRGCGEGYAEVDFVGIEGETWRARWEVQRARKRPGGRLQKPVASLLRLSDGKVIANQVREVADAIRARVGLSFDQFRRAVLLAQNDFAALLKARQDERADLLEALTNTAIFSDLSRAAHRRKTAEEQAIAELESELKASRVLDAEQRAQVEQSLAEANQKLADTRERARVVAEERNWHRQGVSLSAQWVHAEEARQRHAHALEAAEPVARQLAFFQDLLPLKPTWNRMVRRRADSDNARLDGERIAAQVPEAERARDAAEAVLRASAKALEAASDARAIAQPVLTEARRLDTLITGHRADHDQLRKQLRERDRELSDLVNEQAALQPALQSLEATIASWSDWRATHPTLHIDDALWPELGGQLRQMLEHGDAISTLSAELVEIEAQRDSLESARADAEADMARAASVLSDARESLRTAESALDAVNEPAIREAAKALQTSQQAHREAGRLYSDGKRLAAEHADVQERLAALASRTDALRGELAADRQSMIAAGTALADAERALHHARLAAETLTQELRAALQPDQPCLVCGSTEHPAAGQHDVSAQALLDQMRRVFEEAGREERRLQRRLAANEAELGALGTQQQAIDEQVQSLVAQQAANTQALRHALTGAQWLQDGEALPAADQIPSLLASIAESISQQQLALESRQSELDRARQAAIDARRKADVAQTAATRYRARLDELAAERKPLDDRHGTLNAERAVRQQQWQQARERIQPWIASDLRDSADVRTWLGTWSRGNALRQPAKSAESERVELSSRQAELAKQHQRLSGSREQLGRKVQDSASKLASLQTDRQQCLAHPDTAAYAEQLERDETSARETHERARLSLQTAQEALRDLHDRIKANTNQVAQWAKDADEARAQLEAELGVLRVRHPERMPDLSQLDAAFAAIPTDLIEQVETLARQREELRTSEADCRAIEQQRSLWFAENRSARQAEDVEIEYAEIDASLEAIRQNAAQLKATLSQDDETRAGQVAQLAQIQARRDQASRWLTLASLIGSADGKKFREYAQQFTLEVLLEYANQHLDRLAPRYQLRRGNEALSMLVVDRDFGDELRSVHSLSGGESFLVSLALALGLASLSAERVRVESLFIDEGFGSLDADTLNVAMEALDRLQADGRRVGVISHVHDMAERIGVQIRVTPVAPGRSRVSVG